MNTPCFLCFCVCLWERKREREKERKRKREEVEIVQPKLLSCEPDFHRTSLHHQFQIKMVSDSSDLFSHKNDEEPLQGNSNTDNTNDIYADDNSKDSDNN